MTHPANTSRRGFTLIELMLAMTFVSVLLLTIALTVIQMGTIYNRGMTLKEVNQSARDISDNLRRTVQSSGVFEVTPTGADTPDLVSIKNTVGTVVGGRLCTGVSTYIWNTPKADVDTRTHYVVSADGTLGKEVSLVKVPDVGKRYCAKTTPPGAIRIAQPNIRFEDRSQAIELLKTGDRTIRVLDFNVSSAPTATDPLSGQQLYAVSYRLGAGKLEAMNDDLTQCREPGDPESDLAYCTIQQFSIVLRAGSAVN